MIPEIRTRTEYVDVPRKVPYFETKKVTEMVPQIKTRTTYRTESRTVADKVIKTFMVMVPETRTKTVYKTRYRDVPKIRTEVYWENVPETRYRTRLVQVPRQVARENVRRFTVKVPYQVMVCIPHKICRMVPRQITIPIETCCDQCSQNFTELHEASGAYLNYGIEQIGKVFNWVGPHQP